MTRQSKVISAPRDLPVIGNEADRCHGCRGLPEPTPEAIPRRFSPFDYLVFVGSFINLIVVSFIVGHWLFR